MQKKDEIDDSDFVKFSLIMEHLKEIEDIDEIDDLAFERYIENALSLKYDKKY